MEITPYKQTLTHSCLAACMLILSKNQFTEAEEQELGINGSQRTYPLYVVGIPLEFVKRFDRKISVYVDNKFFASVLEEAFLQDERLTVCHKKITISFIRELLKQGPLICHIDDHALGDYSHASHFIILERATEKYVYIVDPWSGERKRIIYAKLEAAINDLKTRIKMCPLLFSIEA